jgi:hypothetical protein
LSAANFSGYLDVNSPRIAVEGEVNGLCQPGRRLRGPVGAASVNSTAGKPGHYGETVKLEGRGCFPAQNSSANGS